MLGNIAINFDEKRKKLFRLRRSIDEQDLVPVPLTMRLIDC